MTTSETGKPNTRDQPGTTLVFALLFRSMKMDLEDAPLSTVEAHNYKYKTSSLDFAVLSVPVLIGGRSYSIVTLLNSSFPTRLQPWT